MGPVGPGQSSIRTSLAMTFSSALPWLDEINDNYDILAFEPRGVGYAAPHAGCFESVWPGRSWDGVVDTASGVIHGGDADEDGEAYAEGTSDLGLRTRLAAVRACGALCAEKALRADYNEDAGTAINCGDSEAISNVTLSEFTSYLRALEGQSTVGALVQGERKLRCLGWPAALHPAYRFSGPFGADALEKGILFVGNTLDPVTPVGNAHLMAGLFKGSVVLAIRALHAQTAHPYGGDRSRNCRALPTKHQLPVLVLPKLCAPDITALLGMSRHSSSFGFDLFRRLHGLCPSSASSCAEKALRSYVVLRS